jgi:hypothetical protein
MNVENYIEYMYLSYILRGDFDQIAGNRWIEYDELKSHFQEAMRTAFASYGYVVGDRYDEVVEKYWKDIFSAGAISEEGDEFTGSYLYMSVSDKDSYARAYLSNNPVTERINTLGVPALERALGKISEQERWDVKTAEEVSEDLKVMPIGSPIILDPRDPDLIVPASDRIVSIGDNHREEMEDALGQVIGEVERENAINGDPDIRQRYLGELAAGRELIHAQSVRAYLLYETLFRLLGTLIERYKDQVLATAAKKLLDLLIEHVFGK